MSVLLNRTRLFLPLKSLYWQRLRRWRKEFNKAYSRWNTWELTVCLKRQHFQSWCRFFVETGVWIGWRSRDCCIGEWLSEKSVGSYVTTLFVRLWGSVGSTGIICNMELVYASTIPPCTHVGFSLNIHKAVLNAQVKQWIQECVQDF